MFGSIKWKEISYIYFLDCDPFIIEEIFHSSDYAEFQILNQLHEKTPSS